MKICKTGVKIISLLLCLSLLSGCTLLGKIMEAVNPKVKIVVGDIVPDLFDFEDVTVMVMVDDEVTECGILWNDEGNGIEDVSMKEQIPKYFKGSLEITYALPKNTDMSALAVDVTAPEGTYVITEALNVEDTKVRFVRTIISYSFEEPEKSTEVQIDVGNVFPGDVVGDIPVRVSIDGESIKYKKLEWVVFDDDGYDYLAKDDEIPDNYYGRLDVYYYLPEGVEVENAYINMNIPGGVYDGTGDVGESDDGKVLAVSHILYGEEQNEDSIIDAVIIVGEMVPGMKFGDVIVQVSLNGKTVPSKAQWVLYDNGLLELDANDIVPKDFFGRLDVIYTLPKGHDSSELNVRINSLGGTYDGTGDYGENENGEVEVWSHIQFGTEPESETQQQTQRQTQETRPPQTQETKPQPPQTQETQPPQTQETQPPQTQETQPPQTQHEHDWVLDRGNSQDASCTSSGTRHFYCTGCSESYDEPVPALGHAWSQYYYNSNKDHYRECSRCGATETGAHQFKKGGIECTICGGVVVN